MEKVVFLFVAVFLLSLHLSGQSTGDVVVLLQGKTFNQNAVPVSVKMVFTNNSGKRTVVKSNSKTGVYQVVLKPGLSYYVTFKGYLTVDSNNLVKIPIVEKYTEMEHDFAVKKIEEGLELMRFSAFKPEDSVLTGKYQEQFGLIKSFLKENINASVVITVAMKDSYFRKKRVRIRYKDKRGRKRSKRVWVKAKTQLNKVLEARLRAVQNYIDSLKIRKSMVVFKTDDKMGPKHKKKKKKRRYRRKRKKHKKKKVKKPAPPPPVDNIIITVGKMMKI